jgi:hypothetical protein
VSLLAPSLAAAFLGLLAFAAYLLHLRRLDAVKEAKALFQQDVAFLTKTLREQSETMCSLHAQVAGRVDTLEKEWKEAAEKVARLDFRGALSQAVGMRKP